MISNSSMKKQYTLQIKKYGSNGKGNQIEN